MSDDLLRRAAQALREESETGDAGERFTRARVMAGLQQNAGRRRLRLAFALPLAACFVAATAFGMKGHTTELWHEVTQALGFTHAEQAPRTKTSTAPHASPKPKEKPPVVEAPAAATEAPAPLEPPALVEAPMPAPSAIRAPRVERAAPLVSSTPSRAPEPAVAAAPAASPAPVNPPPNPSEANDPAHELYRVAHQAHFVEHDFASALRAWDAYLTAAPNGRFAPEARYNRALCLVRLGRKDDAERALRPFADGAYGTYRRDEAAALIEALQR